VPHRNRLQLPWDLLRAFDPTARSAVANARRAAADIGRAVEERRALMAGLEQRNSPELSNPSGASDPSTSSAEIPASDERHLVVLSAFECRELLASRRVGRLAFLAGLHQPLILPVNYRVDGRDILIATGPGPKLQAAVRRDAVAFEVDAIDEETRTGWSVVVTGKATIERASTPRARAAADDEPGPESWAPGPRLTVLRVSTGRITGRWLTGTAS
jgi:nitroimidazol reductase NimA-like FMN-containing flavoprotein (pyridoxamine 5'-phosphate oxidase superfamily)